MTINIIKATGYLLTASILFCAVMFGVYVLFGIAAEALHNLGSIR